MLIMMRGADDDGNEDGNAEWRMDLPEDEQQTEAQANRAGWGCGVAAGSSSMS